MTSIYLIMIKPFEVFPGCTDAFYWFFSFLVSFVSPLYIHCDIFRFTNPFFCNMQWIVKLYAYCSSNASLISSVLFIQHPILLFISSMWNETRMTVNVLICLLYLLPILVLFWLSFDIFIIFYWSSDTASFTFWDVRNVSTAVSILDHYYCE